MIKMDFCMKLVGLCRSKMGKSMSRIKILLAETWEQFNLKGKCDNDSLYGLSIFHSFIIVTPVFNSL